MDIFVSGSASVGGRQYSQSTLVSAARAPAFEETLAAAKGGTLTVRTDDDTGTLTMDSGHGILTGNRLDVYWTNTDGTVGARRGMTVGTVATNSVPIDGGLGDNLPLAATSMRAMVPKEVAFPLTGNDVKSVMVNGQRAGSSFVFTTSGNVAVYGNTIRTAGGSSIWYDGSGVTNPMAGQTVTKVFVSHGDTASSGQIRGDVLTN